MRINHTLSPSFGIDGRFVEFSVSRLRPPSCPAASTTATAVGAERGIDGGQPYFLGAHVYCFLYSIMCLLSIHTTPIKESPLACTQKIGARNKIRAAPTDPRSARGGMTAKLPSLLVQQVWP
uniref:Uncharacterized protein n=1 Tax=Steinernema glaseri TaxID=37863 RepID=A0A1I7ZKK4_9BILA